MFDVSIFPQAKILLPIQTNKSNQTKMKKEDNKYNKYKQILV